MLNLVTDLLALVAALGHQRVHCVVGHDFGSPVAAWCGLIRPDVFASVALMSAPFAGPPGQLTEAQRQTPKSTARIDLNHALGTLDPPRKHYRWYYGTRDANADMLDCTEGLAVFLRSYYHVKSGDWPGNKPPALPAPDAATMARLPYYYVMKQAENMPQTVAPDGPGADFTCDWLTDTELEVYVKEFRRSGFQGGLNWYRCGLDRDIAGQMRLYSGSAIDVPVCFISGDRDWGMFQTPGALEAMQSSACSDFKGVHLVEGAGHWVQQERANGVGALLIEFFSSV